MMKEKKWNIFWWCRSRCLPKISVPKHPGTSLERGFPYNPIFGLGLRPSILLLGLRPSILLWRGIWILKEYTTVQNHPRKHWNKHLSKVPVLEIPMYISLCCPIPIESPFSHAGIWSFETSKGSHPLKSESRFHCEKFHVESLLLEKALKQLICLAEKISHFGWNISHFQ